MAYSVIVILCLTIVPSSFSIEDIHEYLSPKEVQQIFNTDFVPEYELVQVHMDEGRLRKRDLEEGSKLSMRAFGRNINLWLKPSRSVLVGRNTPVYEASYSPFSPGEVAYHRNNDVMEMVGEIFDDPIKMASFVIGTEPSAGRKRINGYVHSENLAVRSMPRNAATEHRRRRREAGEIENLNADYHFVYTIPNKETENFQLASLHQENLQHHAPGTNGTGIPGTIYPEVLVVVDYSICRHYGSNTLQLMEYLLAFWNGVDLKFRSLTSPNVRLNIAGIILAQDQRAIPYISTNLMNAREFNIYKALPNATSFFYEVKDMFPLDSYDISVTMTKLSLGTYYGATVLGLAYVGDACRREEESKLHYGVTIIYDNLAFKGIFIAAHEIGHLLGASHDPGTGDCMAQSGFIMASSARFTKNSSDFSSCSLPDIDSHLKRRKLDCLFNQPKNQRTFPQLLMPGRVNNLRAQCKALGWEEPCEASIRDICVSIYCLNQHGECEDTTTSAMDGTKCGPRNEFCLHHQCVRLPPPFLLKTSAPRRPVTKPTMQTLRPPRLGPSEHPFLKMLEAERRSTMLEARRRSTMLEARRRSMMLEARRGSTMLARSQASNKQISNTTVGPPAGFERRS